MPRFAAETALLLPLLCDLSTEKSCKLGVDRFALRNELRGEREFVVEGQCCLLLRIKVVQEEWRVAGPLPWPGIEFPHRIKSDPKHRDLAEKDV